MNLLMFFLPMIIFLGIITSYEDIKKGKIKNKWIVLSLLYSFSVLSLLIIYLFVSKLPIFFSYVFDYFLNFVIAFIFVFITWKIGMWSAGDAKLFLAYVALLPLSVYSNGYVNYFPSLILFINTFVPLSIFFIFRMLLKTDRKVKKKSFQRIMKKETLINRAISLFGIIWVIRIPLIYFGVKIDIFTKLILIFFVYGAIKAALKRIQIKKIEPKLFSVIFSIIVIITMREYIFSLQFLYTFILYYIFFTLFCYFIYDLGKFYFSKKVDIDELKVGMVPAEVIYKKGRRYFRCVPDISKKIVGEIILKEKPLKRKDISKLNKLYKEGKISNSLKIQATIPFAPILFIGVLLTIISNGLFIYLFKFF